MPSLTNPHSSLPPRLSEIERHLYIENSSVYQLFLLRVDKEFLTPFVSGYIENEEKMRVYLEKLSQEIGLEDVEVGSIMPEKTSVKTVEAFVQEQLF